MCVAMVVVEVERGRESVVSSGNVPGAQSISSAPPATWLTTTAWSIHSTASPLEMANGSAIIITILAYISS